MMECVSVSKTIDCLHIYGRTLARRHGYGMDIVGVKVKIFKDNKGVLNAKYKILCFRKLETFKILKFYDYQIWIMHHAFFYYL